MSILDMARLFFMLMLALMVWAVFSCSAASPFGLHIAWNEVMQDTASRQEGSTHTVPAVTGSWSRSEPMSKALHVDFFFGLCTVPDVNFVIQSVGPPGLIARDSRCTSRIAIIVCTVKRVHHESNAFPRRILRSRESRSS